MNLERLAISQAYLTAEKKRLSEIRIIELESCYLSEFKATGRSNHADFINDVSDHFNGHFNEFDSCYSAAYFLFKDALEDEGSANFDEELHLIGCPHCIEARRLKRQINAIGTKIGQVRGRITMAGNRLINEGISA